MTTPHPHPHDHDGDDDHHHHHHHRRQWEGSAEDFGQKVDLTVRIREILRNYPEGLSILKELLQNADDAGARTVRFCTVEPVAVPAGDTDDPTLTREKKMTMTPLDEVMSGPSLLAYNSAKFSETDFRSIQRIGDSLKKAAGTGAKTGRFGVGVNSTYHLTEVPMFVSGHRVVLFDPQARYVPGIDPANPGKLVDCSTDRGRNLIRSLPGVFDPLKVFGCDLDGRTEFDGTTFRFALRSEEQASSSRLSKRSHDVGDVRDLLLDLARCAPEMLLFLKHVERIEVYDWTYGKDDDEGPRLLHSTSIRNATEKLRSRRSYVMSADVRGLEKPAAVDYVMEIASEGCGVANAEAAGEEAGDDGRGGGVASSAAVDVGSASASAASPLERWIVCNQLGGGDATSMASDATLDHMRLVPWAGVAARVHPPPPPPPMPRPRPGDGGGAAAADGGGKAYCFLPLPVNTGLPVHVNGYFELSSNRRDVWWGGDMAGDGRARAEWNKSLVADVASACYCRLVLAAIRTGHVDADTYEMLFPLLPPSSSSPDVLGLGVGGVRGGGGGGPWAVLADAFYRGVANLPVLHSASASSAAGGGGGGSATAPGGGGWISPSDALLLPTDEGTNSSGTLISPGDATTLAEILERERLPLVRFRRLPRLRATLLARGTCVTTATPAYVREHLKTRPRVGDDRSRTFRGALEDGDRRVEYGLFLLGYCASDLTKSAEYEELAGCQLVPLANGDLGTFSILAPVDAGSVRSLRDMGFTSLSASLALRKCGGDVGSAMEFLFDRDNRQPDDESSPSSSTSSCAEAIESDFEPYFVCLGDPTAGTAELLRDRASHTFVDVGGEGKGWRGHELMRRLFSTDALPSSSLNVDIVTPDMIADVVSRVLPRDWRGAEVVDWNASSEDSSRRQRHPATPTREWFARLWRYLCTQASDYVYRVAEKYPIVPTEQGVVCNLSRGSSVVDASGLDRDVKDAIIAAGARTILPDTLPRDIVVPDVVWSYLHRSGRAGIIGAVASSVRRWTGESPFDCVGDEARTCIYLYLANSRNGPMGESDKLAVRTFPIFRSYLDDESSDTRFVALPSSSGSSWFLLEAATPEDRPLMTSSFLAYGSSSEMHFLIYLGIPKVGRGAFFRDHVLPRLSDLGKETRRSIARSILLEYPKGDETLRALASGARFIPSATTGTLRAPRDLFDPEVPQLRCLMDDDAFPEMEMWSQSDLLHAMRALGLRTTLTWDVVLDCATSIDRDAECIEKLDSVRERGGELLKVLDRNFDTFFPDLAEESDTKKNKQGLFQRVGAVLFEDPEKKRREAEERAKRTAALLSLRWIPVCTSPPQSFLPWRDDFEKMPVAPPSSTRMGENMWLTSYTHRILSDDCHVQSGGLRRLFGWDDPVAVRDVAAQLRRLGESFDGLRLSLRERDSRIVSADQQEAEMREERGDGNGNKQDGDNPTLTLNVLCQTITSEIPRMYRVLDGGMRTEYETSVVQTELMGSPWLWMGDEFVSPEHCAFSSPINATPYLYAVPPDLTCFRNLLSAFGVRNTFGTSDFCEVLRRMAENSRGSHDDVIVRRSSSSLSASQIELAINLCQIVSDENAMKLSDMNIYAPCADGRIRLASLTVYDDAPWLSKNTHNEKELIFLHPKISNTVAEKVGARSLRRILLEKNADTVDFGSGIEHEAFGQSESITRRLKNIIEMYPEGPQQLSELIQNADDARASVVKFMFSRRHYGTSSLLGPRLGDWQGPALLVYNDATFSQSDFANIARIGQASKLENLSTTGRFGLGFNSVFHWTDVPSIVSGEHFVMFDPHELYVPGATDTSRGIKIRFGNSNLAMQFPHQMEPYQHFGCDMRTRFDGTLFRFPFRNDSTASRSQISKTKFTNDAVERLIESFRAVITKMLIFLRNVKKIEVYWEDENGGTDLLYFAEVTNRKMIATEGSFGSSNSHIHQLRSLASTYAGFGGGGVDADGGGWNTISDFISGSSTHLSKDAFYSKLSRTPDDELPQSQHVIQLTFSQFINNSSSVEASKQVTSDGSECFEVSFSKVKGRDDVTGQSFSYEDDAFEVSPASSEAAPCTRVVVTEQEEYLVLMALGGGRCKRMACDPTYRNFKFLPWGGCAALLKGCKKSSPDASSTMRGNAFCFLPLPAETGLPIHINGYFELSANRRDIWHGQDMTGDGQIRSEWNVRLLCDVIAPVYARLMERASRIVGPGKEYNALWPVHSNGDVWKLVVDGFYRECRGKLVLHTPSNGGRWITPKQSVVVEDVESDPSLNADATKDAERNTTLARILLKEELNVCVLPKNIINLLQQEECQATAATPSMVRAWYKKPGHHPSLQGDRDDALFLLSFCASDVVDDNYLSVLIGLPLLPMADDGGLRVIGPRLSHPPLEDGTDGSNDHSSTFFVSSSEAERDLLSPNASEFLVDTWTSNKEVNELLLNDNLHAIADITKLDCKNFVSMLGRTFPTEWAGLPEVRWRSTKYSGGSSPCSEQWISNLWRYIVTPSATWDDDHGIHHFVDTWQILPASVGGDDDKTLLILAKDMAVISPMKPLAIGQAIPETVSDVLKAIGVRILDVSAFGGEVRDSVLQTLEEGYVQPPTSLGVLKAIKNSFPDEIENGDLIRRLALRFKYVSNHGKEKLREFFGITLEELNGSELDMLRILRAFPIFPVFSRGKASGVRNADSAAEYTDLIDEKFRPPPSADTDLLDDRFVKVLNKQDASLLDLLGIKVMTLSAFYENYICPRIEEGNLNETSEESAVLKLFEDFPMMSKDSSWVERMSSKLFVSDRQGGKKNPCDLYDPEAPALKGLLNDSMLPAHRFCEPSTLASLRSLGMMTRLSCEGVLSIAQQCEELAKQDSTRSAARKTSESLLSFVDSDAFFDLVHERYGRVSHDHNAPDVASLYDEEGDMNNSSGSAFLQKLREISWLPVEDYSDTATLDALKPPQRPGRSPQSLSAPKLVRPKEDAWLCSYTMDILSANVRSDFLHKFFRWDRPIPCIAIASQVVALASLFDESGRECQEFRQRLAVVIPRLYGILQDHFRTAAVEEKDKVLQLFEQRPWLWVGDRFVATDQVAFEALENARPYLFNVPHELLVFSDLLEQLGVRQNFSAEDFVRLTADLNGQLAGNKASARQLDLAVGMAKLLSRLTDEDLARVDLNEVYLPSNDCRMHRAKQMTYNDAPWLSSILSSRARSRQTFVHGDISHVSARRLGAKSFREVMTAWQNGMAKIPCPNPESLRQLFAERADYGKGRRRQNIENCKALFDLLELAEIHGVKHVSVMFDRRRHRCESLIHPMLSQAQGPSVVVCFHEKVVDEDEIVRLSSPSRFFMRSVSGEAGCGLGGKGFPRSGFLGLCGAFRLSDCPQILLGNQMIFVDPTGQYFFDGGILHKEEGGTPNAAVGLDKDVNNEIEHATATPSDSDRNKTATPTARRYLINSEFPSLFSDQIEPFVSLPFGVRQSMASSTTSKGPMFRGTIFRLPLRTDKSMGITEQEFVTEESVSDLMKFFVEKAPLSFLFTYNLQSISVDEFAASSSAHTPVLLSRVSSSPLARRNHIDELVGNKDWKKGGNKLSKLFQSSWAPVHSSLVLQISNRFGSTDENEVVDTYLVRSVLAPDRLRQMACTEALKPLRLIPCVSIAAHLSRSKGISRIDFPPNRGTIFSGMDSFQETGLRFMINVPVFFHELQGNVLLDKGDDADFRQRFPGIRDVKIKGGEETRAIALHVWNRQALSSAFLMLIPPLMIELRDSFEQMQQRALLYRFWPHFKMLRKRFQDFLPSTIHEDLAKMDMFLTRNGFQKIDDGCFASPEFPLKGDAAHFFQEKLSLFNMPRAIAEDMERCNINIKILDPRTARQMLKRQKQRTLRLEAKVALELLLYCMADIPVSDDIDANSRAREICSELNGLCLMPLADGSIGQIGRDMIIASAAQQNMLPCLKNKFVSLLAVRRLSSYFECAGFIDAIGLSRFGPKVLANNISSVLPWTWEGQDFVPWQGGGDDNGPSKVWLYQFWKEVAIWDHDAVQLFRRWPLIPTASGELASCSNARFVLSFYPGGGDVVLRTCLKEDFDSLVEQFEEQLKRELMTEAAEARAAASVNEDGKSPEFGNLYYDEDEVSSDDEAENDQMEPSADFEGERPTDESSIVSSIASSGPSENSAHSSVLFEGEETQAELALGQQPENSRAEPRSSDPSLNNSSVRVLHGLLIKLRCPVLESSFFDKDHLERLLPSDRLSVTRNCLSTLNQCLNFWVTYRRRGTDSSSPSSEDEPRLRWSNLEDEEMDNFLLLLAMDQNGSRLSLMPSDLAMLRKLPVFQSLSGDRVSLKDRDQHFTLDDSVDMGCLNRYLPDTVKRRFLVEKPSLKDLLEDLGVEPLTEAKVLQKFVLPEFVNMPLAQKEAVSKTILIKWEVLRVSDQFITTLKGTPFVKKRLCDQNDSEVVFVQADHLLDPRNEFLRYVFDKCENVFPCEEFGNADWLDILSEVGLQSRVDKDIFLKCAWRVEEEDCPKKGMRLLEYFAEHFGEFYDQSQEFCRKLADVKCVPAELDGAPLSLYRFRDVGAPSDRHIVFKVQPIIPESVVPPQVMFSSLGIVSPPSIGSVLKHLRLLTDDGEVLDHWRHRHGSIEETFGHIFSFLQENYDRLSPRVQEGLRDRAMVPVGTSLVKSSRLFFRLAKDLAPFFYEVPRGFGAYDKLLRSLGVRDVPRASDYAISLLELKRELGEGMLNANELKSVVQVLTLVAEENDGEGLDTQATIFAPDLTGSLVSVNQLFQNDAPWLVQKGTRLKQDLVRLTHPKLSKDLCRKLGIDNLSRCVKEELEGGFAPVVVPGNDAELAQLERSIRSDAFIGSVEALAKPTESRKCDVLRQMEVVPVENIRTRFLLSNGNVFQVDITQDAETLCFVEDNKVLVAKRRFPAGVTSALVIASAICDSFRMDRVNVACLSAMLSSGGHNSDMIARALGSGGRFDEEVTRGDPGTPVTGADLELIELKPLKVFGRGEIVAVKEGDESSSLNYAVVVEGGGGSSLSRLLLKVGLGREAYFLSTKIYSFRAGAGRERNVDEIHLSEMNGMNGLVADLDDDNLEASLIEGAGPERSAAPVDRNDVLKAVQDLLRSANMSLKDDVENVMETNMKLQDELAQKDVHIESLVNEGRGLATNLSKGVDAFLCPITREIMEDPVICADGHTYERKAIELWLRSNSRSPKTNHHLPSRVLIPNYAMKSTIEAMTDNVAAVKKFTQAFD